MIIKKNKIQHNSPQKEESAKEQPVEEIVQEQTRPWCAESGGK